MPLVKYVIQQSHIGFVSGQVFAVGRVLEQSGRAIAVVVAAGLIKRDEHCRSLPPNRVFHVRHFILEERNRVLPQTLIPIKEQSPDQVKPFQRVHAPIVRAMTIGPFVIARRKNHGVLE